MYIIYLLTALFCVCVGTSYAAIVSADGKHVFLKGAEPSLDFSKNYPKVENLVIGFETSNWREIVDYYLSQNNDLGLSENRNLKNIEVFSRSSEFIPFFRKTYLPQVKYLHVMDVDDSSHWDFLMAFPHLHEFKSYEIPSFEHFAMYNPHLKVIDIFTKRFREFSSEELNAIANLSELRNLKYSFYEAAAHLKDIEKQMQALVPHVKIQLNLLFYNDH